MRIVFNKYAFHVRPFIRGYPNSVFVIVLGLYHDVSDAGPLKAID